MSSKKLKEVAPSTTYFSKKHSKHVLGNWTKINAGGCSSEPTFALNPQYKLCISPNLPATDVPDEVEVVLELTSHNQYPVGIAILEASVGPLYACDAVEISQLKSNSSFLVELNTLRTKIKKSLNYIVIVSTYAAQQVWYAKYL